MESLLKLKKLLNFVGQYEKNGKEDSLSYKAYGIFFYLAITLNRIEQFASMTPVVVGVLNGTFKGVFFLIHKKEVKSLLNNIQETFNTQLLKKRPEKHYKAANSRSDYLVHGFRWVMGICGWTDIIGPTAYALYHYILGTLTDDKIKISMPALLPYDVTKLSSYVPTCIAYAVAINFWVFSIAAIDAFFLSVCVALNGFFNDLMDMFTETDILVDFSDDQSNFTNDKRKYVAMKSNLNACIQFHNVVDSQIQQFQKLVGPIIFAQYFFSLSQLGTLVFATIMIPGIPPDTLVFNIILMVACLTELLIYCYFGNELTSGANKLSTAIYGCKWYKYHPKLRKYLIISMCRSQKEIHIHGFHMVIASMETFSLLINKVASAFTLLKSIVGE